MTKEQETAASRRLLAACDVTTFRASGPGGQHRNRRETGIRLVHRATGLVVIATERRSQHQNKVVALERMARKLAARRRRKKPRRRTKPTPRARERRLEHKRQRSAKKDTRRKMRPDVDE